MNQSQFPAITCNLLKAREKSRVHGASGFGFTSHWFKHWRESLKPIFKRSNRNHVITFDSHLKTALILTDYCPENFSQGARDSLAGMTSSSKTLSSQSDPDHCALSLPVLLKIAFRQRRSLLCSSKKYV